MTVCARIDFIMLQLNAARDYKKERQGTDDIDLNAARKFKERNYKEVQGLTFGFELGLWLSWDLKKNYSSVNVPYSSLSFVSVFSRTRFTVFCTLVIAMNYVLLYLCTSVICFVILCKWFFLALQIFFLDLLKSKPEVCAHFSI